MDSINKEEILQKIQDVMDKHDYILENREDFIEARTSWATLAEMTEAFYNTLLTIQTILK